MYGYTKEDALNDLKKRLSPGDTVWTVLRHRSKSGISQSVSAFVIKNDGPIMLDYQVSKVLGLPYNTHYGGVNVRGVGMDTGFWLVYELRKVLGYDKGEQKGLVNLWL